MEGGHHSCFVLILMPQLPRQQMPLSPIPSSVAIQLLYKLKCHNLAKPTNELSHGNMCQWNGSCKNYISMKHCLLPLPCCLALALLCHISTRDICYLEVVVFPQHLSSCCSPTSNRGNTCRPWWNWNRRGISNGDILPLPLPLPCCPWLSYEWCKKIQKMHKFVK